MLPALTAGPMISARTTKQPRCTRMLPKKDRLLNKPKASRYRRAVNGAKRTFRNVTIPREARTRAVRQTPQKGRARFPPAQHEQLRERSRCMGKKSRPRGAAFRVKFTAADLSDYDPIASAPVAVTTAGLAPTVMIMPRPSPVVGMDAQPQVGTIGRPTAHAPTIAFVVTNHRS
jgi:hypothetical protein